MLRRRDIGCLAIRRCRARRSWKRERGAGSRPVPWPCGYLRGIIVSTYFLYQFGQFDARIHPARQVLQMNVVQRCVLRVCAGKSKVGERVVKNIRSHVVLLPRWPWAVKQPILLRKFGCSSLTPSKWRYEHHFPSRKVFSNQRCGVGVCPIVEKQFRSRSVSEWLPGNQHSIFTLSQLYQATSRSGVASSNDWIVNIWQLSVRIYTLRMTI